MEVKSLKEKANTGTCGKGMQGQRKGKNRNVQRRGQGNVHERQSKRQRQKIGERGKDKGASCAETQAIRVNSGKPLLDECQP